MGNNSIKSKKSNKKKRFFCCLCSSSLSPSSSFSIDNKTLSTFDQIISNEKNSQTYEDIEKFLSNTSFELIIKKFQLNIYLKDYLNRLKYSNINQTFKTYFSSSTIIYPSNSLNQILIDNLNLFLIIPPESILSNYNSSKIHEQLRSKCYFIPLTNCQIEPNDNNDNEDQEKSLTIDNNTNKISNDCQSSWIFISNDLFQTGFIHINQDKIAKEFFSFCYFSSEDNRYYLSSNLIEKWFYTLILVNQTCKIAKQFLIGKKTHMTCLIKQENSFSSDNKNFIFASLRLPPCKYINEPISDDFYDENFDEFSSIFLSNNRKLFNDCIHIDYEEYSFAFRLSHWPKYLIENYYTHPNRYLKRQWPRNFHMNILIKKSLLLIPDHSTNKWKINFDFIENYLFELMNESTLFIYILYQQLFSQTYSTRLLIKHCFLNYLEKYGLPTFLNNQNNLMDLINHFLKDLSEQIKKKFFPNYFNHQNNLLNSNDNYNQWFDYIIKCLDDRFYLSSSSSSSISSKSISNRSIIIKFLFDFTNQLYQTFHHKQSNFYLNDNILLDLHKNLSKENIFFEELINNKQIIQTIQENLISNFEINAELVHNCINQIRKSQSSLIFHYTWTIFIQYLHTYYNVLWNIYESDFR